MAVSLDPVHYYPTPGVEAVVGMRLVFKPAYVLTVSFSSLLMTLSDLSNNPKERLSKACMTFLNVSPESEVFPLCRDYPMLLDLTSKELVSSHFQRSHVTNFRAFKLPLVRGVSPRTKEWAHYVNIPCLMGSVSYLLTPHQEGGLPEKGFRSSSTLSASLAPTRTTGLFMKTRSLLDSCSASPTNIKRGRRRQRLKRQRRKRTNRRRKKRMLPPTPTSLEWKSMMARELQIQKKFLHVLTLLASLWSIC